MPAPKGNKFGLGNSLAGRPRMYETAEDLWIAAQCYFEDSDKDPWIKKELIKSGELAGTLVDVELKRPYTEISFCHYIGITRQAYQQCYKQNEAFIGTVKAIDDCIRNQKYEGAALGVFNSNFIARDLGMSDKREIEANVEQKNVNVLKIGGIEIEIE